MKYDYYVIVIGAGSGGLVVASGAATFGAKVALIEGDKMGGDCLNTGCVPSKTFLKSAHLAHDINNSAEYGLKSSLGKTDLARVMKRVRSVIEEIEPHDSKPAYEKKGAKVFLAKAQIIDPHTVKAGKKTITGKYIVIASGSEPVIPPIPGLKKVKYLTNKNIFQLKKLPRH
ncbi:MAG: FAD-dependent oxidoreductase, partial [Spirochaetes bacterium]|nr:FAD-dependent oxidoreductase [Spirochaetota bacterium]